MISASSSASTLLATAAALSSRGDHTAAADAARKAVASAPGNGHVSAGAAAILRTAGHLSEALSCYRSAYSAQPGNIDVTLGLGTTLLDLNAPGEARGILFQAVAALPGSLAAGFHMALCLLKLGDQEAAVGEISRLEGLFRNDANVVQLKSLAGRLFGIKSYIIEVNRPILERDPQTATAVGELLTAISDPAERNTLKERLELICRRKPGTAKEWKTLAVARWGDEGYERAIETLEEGVRCTGDSSLRLYCALTLPKVPLSLKQIDISRTNMNRHLDALINEKHPPQNLLKSVNKTAMHLAYHGRHDKDLQRKIAAAHLAVSPDLRWTAPHCSHPRQSSKLRIGFLSAHLHRHAVGSLMGSLMRDLDPAHFESFVIRFAPAPDNEGQAIGSAAKATLILPPSIEAARNAIAELELDFLLYADIGMEPFGYYLALSRLARVQGVWPGHPITTGLPDMDVFFSSVLSEPADGDDHYSEKLIRLSKLPAYTLGRSPNLEQDHLSKFGFSPKDRIYACPVMIYKFHPELDLRFAQILRKDPHAKIVVVGMEGYWFEALYQRFSDAMPDVVDRIIVLSWLNKQEFFALMTRADVVLDTIHFGGGNTCFDAFAVGTPVVTQPGRFYRGRATMAKYRQMDIDGLVAGSEQEYVDLAVTVANNDSFRSVQSAAIRENYHKLLMPPGLLDEYQDTFAALVAGAEYR